MSDGLLQVKLLGGVSLSLNGQAVDSFVSRKATALFIYLICQQRPIARETLAGLLWPNNSQSRALANLSVALTSVRKSLAQYVGADRNNIWFDSKQPFAMDIALFEPMAPTQQGGSFGAAAVERIERQFTAYKGDFLSGFYLRATPEFEAWQLLEQERIRQLALQNFHQLSEQYLNSGSYAAGINVAQKVLALDPLHEGGHRLLMKLFASNGMSSQAVAQYEKCAALLEDELGVEPDEETDDLLAAIQSKTFSLVVSDQFTREVTGALPPQASDPFYGREEEIAWMTRWLTDSRNRLLTLAGPGGVGKTRLMSEVANQAQAEFNDGIWLIPLQSAYDLPSMCLAMAATLKIPLSGNQLSADTVIQHLRPKHCLLLLDNLEQLIDPETTQFIGRIISDCPLIKLVTTSRHKLELHQEQSLVITGLPVRSERGDPGRSPAVKLFVNHARKRQPGFSLDTANQEIISEICTMAAGLPLAIVLAAGWVPMLTPAGILAEMTKSLDFLESNAADLPHRHRSLRSVFDSSWELLGEAERQIFAQLALLQSSFTYMTGTAIADLTHLQLRDLLNKSLVQISAEGRYQLHPYAKEYGLQKLDGFPRLKEDTISSYLAHFATTLSAALSGLNGPRSKDISQTLIIELADLLQMWHLATETKQFEYLAESLSAFQRLCRLKGFVKEAAHLLETTVAVVPIENRTFRPELLTTLASLYIIMNRLEEGKQAAETALATMERGNPLRARAHLNAGDNCWRLGLYEDAKAHFESAWSLEQAESDATRLSANVRYLHAVTVAYGDADFNLAQTYLREALHIWQRLNDLQGQSMAYNVMGIFAYEKRDMTAALQFQHENLRICQQLADQISEADARVNLANIYNRILEPTKALPHYKSVIDMTNAAAPQIANALLGTANAFGLLGQFETATQYRDQAMRNFIEQNNLLGQAYALISRGMAELCQENFTLAHIAFEEAAQKNRVHTGLMATQIACWQGWVQLGLGNVIKAREAFADALADESAEIIGAATLGLAELDLLQNEREAAVEKVAFVQQTLLARQQITVEQYEMLLWRLYLLSKSLQFNNFPDILSEAFSWIQARAAAIEDIAEREAYLKNVAANRHIIGTYLDGSR